MGWQEMAMNQTPPRDALLRRRLLTTGGTVSALAAAAAALPLLRPDASAAGVTVAKDADTSGGYRLSEHVLRYYQTTKV
jgi:hypothetical protein